MCNFDISNKEDICSLVETVLEKRNYVFLNESDFKFWFAKELLDRTSDYDITLEFPFTIDSDGMCDNKSKQEEKTNDKIDLVVWENKDKQYPNGIIAAFEFKCLIQNFNGNYIDKHGNQVCHSQKPGPQDRYRFYNDIHRLEYIDNLVWAKQPINKYCVFITNIKKYIDPPTAKERVAMQFGLYKDRDGLNGPGLTLHYETSSTAIASKFPDITLKNSYPKGTFDWKPIKFGDDLNVWYLVLKID